MITIYLIRHGKTEGNLKKRYIGTTDEPLCEEGIRLLKKYKEQGKYPEADIVFVSPMKRCIQTADLLYPGTLRQIIEEFRECDFGMFENKNYLELNGLLEYQAWIDSGGELPFPGGESREQFGRRCLKGFEKLLRNLREFPEESVEENSTGKLSAACIVHGGTIMSIMEAYADPPGSYYDFQIGNAEGFVLELQSLEKKGNWRKLWN